MGCKLAKDLKLTENASFLLLTDPIKTPTLDNIFKVSFRVPDNQEKVKWYSHVMRPTRVTLPSNVTAPATTVDFGIMNDNLSEGNVVQVGDELLLILSPITTGGSITSWDVERGFAGTAAIAHNTPGEAFLMSDTEGDGCYKKVCKTTDNESQYNIIQELEDCYCISKKAKRRHGEEYGPLSIEEVERDSTTKRLLQLMNRTVIYGVRYDNPNNPTQDMMGGIKWFLTQYNGVNINVGGAITKAAFDGWLKSMADRDSTVNVIGGNSDTLDKIISLLPPGQIIADTSILGQNGVTSGFRVTAYQSQYFDYPLYFYTDKDFKDGELYALDSNAWSIHPTNHEDGGDYMFKPTEFKECHKVDHTYIGCEFTISGIDAYKQGYLYNIQ